METINEYFCEVENNANNCTVVPISSGEPEWAGPADGSHQGDVCQEAGDDEEDELCGGWNLLNFLQFFSFLLLTSSCIFRLQISQSCKLLRWTYMCVSCVQKDKHVVVG